MYYKLDGRVPVPCRNHMEWSEWFAASADERVVARTHVLDTIVSTVFTGIDANFLSANDSETFETAVFNESGTRLARWTHATWDAAERAHAVQVARLMEAVSEATASGEELIASIRRRFNTDKE